MCPRVLNTDRKMQLMLLHKRCVATGSSYCIVQVWNRLSHTSGQLLVHGCLPEVQLKALYQN
jgi:hypothetical protein